MARADGPNRPCRVSSTANAARQQYIGGRSANPYRSLDQEVLDNFKYGGPKSRSNTRQGHRAIVPSKRDPYTFEALQVLKEKGEELKDVQRERAFRETGQFSSASQSRTQTPFVGFFGNEQIDNDRYKHCNSIQNKVNSYYSTRQLVVPNQQM